MPSPSYANRREKWRLSDELCNGRIPPQNREQPLDQPQHGGRELERRARSKEQSHPQRYFVLNRRCAASEKSDTFVLRLRRCLSRAKASCRTVLSQRRASRHSFNWRLILSETGNLLYRLLCDRVVLILLITLAIAYQMRILVGMLRDMSGDVARVIGVRKITEEAGLFSLLMDGIETFWESDLTEWISRTTKPYRRDVDTVIRKCIQVLAPRWLANSLAVMTGWLAARK